MSQSTKQVLYAGDSGPAGVAGYLRGVLKYAGFRVTHVPPDRKISVRMIGERKHVFILSDYSHRRMGHAIEKKICGQVGSGSGLLMVGGWGSFSGPFGGWRGSLIEKLLPVTCLTRDDRLNFPSGAHFFLKEPHVMFAALSMASPPAVVGINQVKVKPGSRTLLCLKQILGDGMKITYDSREHPLLVVRNHAGMRTAAYMSDFAPHWCGGFVDWGNRSLSLPVDKTRSVQVGNAYALFIASLVQWLAGDFTSE